MKNLKKLTKTVTAVILGAALLTGCGSKEDVKTANAQVPAENRNAAVTTASAENSSLEAASLEEGKSEGAGVTEPVTVKLGVVGENNEQWEPVIEALAKENITLELVKFSDYSLPNQALADGEIDLNSFQHYAYLNNEIADKGLDLTVIGETIIAPLGLYSDKISDVSELKEGDKIAIPSDATNGGRALKVLEAAGVITVDQEAGYTPVLSDITDNPLNLEFIEVEAANTPSLLPDVAAAIINGGHAVDNGLFPEEDAVYLETVQEGSDNPYINIVVARTADKDNGIYKRVVEEYRTEAVAKVIEEVYKGAYIPTWE
ncbi:MAG: MetQ/NlpA family ABC transporter substrate-binding protein [Lachnospiraceae bacterium]|nr:MetQ/NlpA family ABC transporter substrate-binding protein [Lachnospiraceae bacterium]